MSASATVRNTRDLSNFSSEFIQASTSLVIVLKASVRGSQETNPSWTRKPHSDAKPAIELSLRPSVIKLFETCLQFVFFFCDLFEFERFPASRKAHCVLEDFPATSPGRFCAGQVSLAQKMS